MERIGVLGGTFDPVHREHISMADGVMRELALDRLIVMPTFVPPHKVHSECAPAADRLEMCRLAFAGRRADVCGYEIERGGTSYTYKTLEHLKEKYPESKLYFIVGGDMLVDFKTWRYPERILAAADLAVFRRDGYYADVEAERKYFKSRFGKGFTELAYTGRRVSSTKIRIYAMFGLDVFGFVPENVGAYMEKRGLYPPTPAVELVKSVLDKRRFRHTANVAACALDKAKTLGIDRDKAFDACVLHDIAKYADKALYPGAVAEDVPAPVAHAFLGAYMLENVFGVKDGEILDAVRYHTTARAGMSPLEKLVFTADMVEEDRCFAGVEKLRRLYDTDFERCFAECVRTTYEHLLKEGKNPYKYTEEAYEYYVKEK